MAISSHLDRRPVGFCTNPEGTLTSNAQLTGRLLVLDWIEILCISGYLICDLGFAGANHDFTIELEFVTRGGKQPFILALDANSTPTKWDDRLWGEEKFLDHIDAEIVVVQDSKFTCTGAKHMDGGNMFDYFIISKILLLNY